MKFGDLDEAIGKRPRRKRPQAKCCHHALIGSYKQQANLSTTVNVSGKGQRKVVAVGWARRAAPNDWYEPATTTHDVCFQLRSHMFTGARHSMLFDDTLFAMSCVPRLHRTCLSFPACFSPAVSQPRDGARLLLAR